MKVCRGTKSIHGCGKELPIDSFKISSINENTGAVYRKNICRKCEYGGERKERILDPETVIFNAANTVWR